MRFVHHVDLPLNTSWHSACWLLSTLLSSPLDILTNSCWWDVDSFPQTCIIRALRRRKHTGAHRCWRTQKFPCCPSSSMLSSVHTQSNKMNKLRLLTRTNNDFRAVYFQEYWFSLNSGDTVELQYLLIQADCDTQISSKTKGRGVVCFNIKNKWCSVAPVESQLGSLMLKTLLFLCKPFCSLWEFASIIFAVVYISPQAKANGMPCLLSGQIIKMKTKHPDSAVFIQGNWRNEFPPNTGENTKCREASSKVHSSRSPMPFMSVIQGPDGANVLMMKADISKLWK